jgi:hypothetical protein
MIAARFSVDYENNNDRWDWDKYKRKLDSLEKEYGDFVYRDDDNVLTTNGRVAGEIKEYCVAAEGWEDIDAPLYAIHPILFCIDDTQNWFATGSEE